MAHNPVPGEDPKQVALNEQQAEVGGNTELPPPSRPRRTRRRVRPSSFGCSSAKTTRPPRKGGSPHQLPHHKRKHLSRVHAALWQVRARVLSLSLYQNRFLV